MGNNKGLLVIIVVVLVGIFAVLVANSAHRTPGEKISDGMHDIGQGVSDAAHRATH